MQFRAQTAYNFREICRHSKIPYNTHDSTPIPAITVWNLEKNIIVGASNIKRIPGVKHTLTRVPQLRGVVTRWCAEFSND